MHIKQIKLSTIVLVFLVVLSFSYFVFAQEKSEAGKNIFLDSDQDGLSDEEEKTWKTDPQDADTDNDSYMDGAEVKSGYDPTKPAPGDKLIADTSVPKTETTNASSTNNLTQKMAEEVSALTQEAGDGGITMEQLQKLVDENLNQTQDIELPEISIDAIKIKEQDYSKLSEEEQKKRKKEDFAGYISAVFYILSSNSPKAITTGDDLRSFLGSFTQEITMAIVNRSPKSLDKIETSGKKIVDQMKQVEVPEEMTDVHLKILAFGEYSIAAKDFIGDNTDDPISGIANLSKVQGLVTNILSFTSDIQAKFSEYDISYDENIKNNLESLGVDVNTIDNFVKVPEAGASELENSLDAAGTSLLDTGSL